MRRYSSVTCTGIDTQQQQEQPVTTLLCLLAATVNSIGGKWEVPTGIFRMQSAQYNRNANELAWVQPNVTNKEVVVAVLDTGIDAGHPDLVNNVVGGLSFVGEDPLEDLNGHGTHVAGTISANNNGFGTSGAYPGTKVFALQVGGGSCVASLAHVTQQSCLGAGTAAETEVVKAHAPNKQQKQ